MNNAGIGAKGTSWEGHDNWHKVFEVNVFGYVPSTPPPYPLLHTELVLFLPF